MQISLKRTDLKLSFSGLFFAKFFVPGDITFYIRAMTVSCYGLCSVVFFLSRELHGREGKAEADRFKDRQRGRGTETKTDRQTDRRADSCICVSCFCGHSLTYKYHQLSRSPKSFTSTVRSHLFKLICLINPCSCYTYVNKNLELYSRT